MRLIPPPRKPLNDTPTFHPALENCSHNKVGSPTGRVPAKRPETCCEIHTMIWCIPAIPAGRRPRLDPNRF